MAAKEPLTTLGESGEFESSKLEPKASLFSLVSGNWVQKLVINVSYIFVDLRGYKESVQFILIHFGKTKKESHSSWVDQSVLY